MPVKVIEFHEQPIENFVAQRDDPERIYALVSHKAQQYLDAVGQPVRERFELAEFLVGSCVVMQFQREQAQDITLWAFDDEGLRQAELLKGIYLKRELEHGRTEPIRA